jgi:predicted Zn-dependent protease
MAYYYLGVIYRTQAGQLRNAGAAQGASAKANLAVSVYNEGLAAFPSNENLQEGRVSAYLEAGRAREVQQELCSKADADAKDKLSLYACGTLLLEEKEPGRAVAYLEKAVAADPAFDIAVYNLSLGYLRLGIQTRDEANAKNPDAPNTAYKEIIRKAVPHVQALTTAKADNLQYWELAGKIYAALGMEKEANAAYDKVDALRKGN